MEIIDLMKTNEKVNELYFILARTSFLTRKRRGVLHIKTSYIKEYFDFLCGAKYRPDFSLRYKKTNVDYDDDTQFVMKINSTDEIVIDKIKPRFKFYCRQDTELNHTFIDTLPCLGCDCVMKVEIEYKDATCKCTGCDQIHNIKSVYECCKCCTQYIYF